MDGKEVVRGWTEDEDNVEVEVENDEGDEGRVKSLGGRLWPRATQTTTTAAAAISPLEAASRLDDLVNTNTSEQFFLYYFPFLSSSFSLSFSFYFYLILMRNPHQE